MMIRDSCLLFGATVYNNILSDKQQYVLHWL